MIAGTMTIGNKEKWVCKDNIGRKWVIMYYGNAQSRIISKHVMRNFLI